MPKFLDNPAAAFGLSADYPQQTFPAVAANTIAVGEVVAMSTSPGYVIRNLVATSAGLQCGTALNAATAGKAVEVVTGGWQLVLKGTAAVTVGNVVKADPTVSGAVGNITNGLAITTVGDARGIIGTCVASATAGDATVAIFVGKF